MNKIHVSKETQTMIKSWTKVFLASSFAVYAAGSVSVGNIINAGLVSVIPVIISWLDPSDKRFGHYKVEKSVPVKKAVKKAVKKVVK